MSFRALLLTKPEDRVLANIEHIDEADLGDKGIIVDVSHSTINYKDAMAVTGRPGIVRSYPMVPGVDVVGTVAQSSDPDLAVGSTVTSNGWDVGEAHWGGFADKATLEPHWPTPVPAAFTAAQAAAIGTAGYTAMLCVIALEQQGVTPDSGPVLVTGAGGGVGSVAVAVLAKLGFEVVAATGRADSLGGYLSDLGASSVIDRATLAEPGRPLQKAVYAGAVDAAGSVTLANVIAQVQPEGSVACCGLAHGVDLPTTVLPFILRGVRLIGINCVHRPQADRREAWNRLASDLDPASLEEISDTIGLEDVVETSKRLLDGQVKGRVVIDLSI